MMAGESTGHVGYKNLYAKVADFSWYFSSAAATDTGE